MYSLRLTVVFLSAVFTAGSTTAGAAAEDLTLQLNEDVLGLIVFKSGLHDPNSALSSWTEDDDSPCSWHGVQCSPATGRVIRLGLDGLGLSGKIGRGLEKLSSLYDLSLAGNRFAGGITPGLAGISRLRWLNLSNNAFSGGIPPELGDVELSSLDLSGNALSGAVPGRLFSRCRMLRYLSLTGNALSGSVPSSLYSCWALGGLNLSGNHFSGSLEFNDGVWSLRRLRVLDLSHNWFAGEVSNGVAYLHNLKEFNLAGNSFEGAVPADIGYCPHLYRLDLADNLFSGEVPTSIQRLQSLSYLRLANNKFAGELPPWIGNLSSIQLIDFSSNQLTGSLPASLGNLKLLNSLDISSNRLTGELPESLSHCTALSELRLKDNDLAGSIPAKLFDLGLRELDLSSNRLTDLIPPGSTNLFDSIIFMNLSKNNLTGVIPPEMGLCFHLQHLNLSWNNLHSRLPPEFGMFSNLSVLDLRNSGIYGSIPSDLCDSGSLAVLQLDGNALTGPIPDEIGICSSLYLLSLSYNELNESIPESISNIKKLKILKLEHNRLSGEIPLELGSLDDLLAVNISYNRLIGRLPIGSIFPSLDQSSLQGNLGLCSPLLAGPCKMNVPKPLVLDPNAYLNGRNGGKMLPSPSHSSPNDNDSRHRKFLSVSAIIAISAAIIILAGVLVVALLNVSARKRLAFIETAMESMCSSSPRSRGAAPGRLVLFSNSDIKYEDWADNAETVLSKAGEIGSGVMGTVYRASIGEERRQLAIKRLITANIIQYQDDFDREVRILAKAKHPNVMNLQGYYWTPQLQLLITDYAPNRSLHAQLHERDAATPTLSWANRFKIILGTAKGLGHLHQCRPQIIHYGLKPSNILLDEYYNPKVSDFGLARLLPKLDKHVLSSRFQSAVGYVAPELACQSLRVNEKCDIYGYGVMILEVVTGRRPVEYGEDDVVILTDYVRTVLEQGNALGCVDPNMGEYPEEEVLPVLKLGLVCTSQIPSSRPSMAEVVQILQVIKTPVPERIQAY